MEAKASGISITLPVGPIRRPGPLYLAREVKLPSHRFNSPDTTAEAVCPTYTLLCEWSSHSSRKLAVCGNIFVLIPLFRPALHNYDTTLWVTLSAVYTNFTSKSSLGQTFCFYIHILNYQAVTWWFELAARMCVFLFFCVQVSQVQCQCWFSVLSLPSNTPWTLNDKHRSLSCNAARGRRDEWIGVRIWRMAGYIWFRTTSGVVDCNGSKEKPGTTHHPDGSETKMLVVEYFSLASPN